MKHEYDPDAWRVCKVCGAGGDLLCSQGQDYERMLRTRRTTVTDPELIEIDLGNKELGEGVTTDYERGYVDGYHEATEDFLRTRKVG